jgi:hypothetical protein
MHVNSKTTTAATGTIDDVSTFSPLLTGDNVFASKLLMDVVNATSTTTEEISAIPIASFYVRQTFVIGRLREETEHECSYLEQSKNISSILFTCRVKSTRLGVTIYCQGLLVIIVP